MRTFVGGLCLLYFTAILYSEGFCSLIVRVRDPMGREAEALVVVEEDNGRKIEKENRAGGVKFCDLGIMPVTVTVGHPACNQVVVRNVPLEWGITQAVLVTYDRQPCLIDAPPVAACQFLFRFIDGQHNFVSGAELKTQSPYEETHKADEVGRLLLRIPAGQELQGVASANGYERAELRIPCITKNRRVEQFVTLKRQDRQP